MIFSVVTFLSLKTQCLRVFHTIPLQACTGKGGVYCCLTVLLFFSMPGDPTVLGDTTAALTAVDLLNAKAVKLPILA